MGRRTIYLACVCSALLALTGCDNTFSALDQRKWEITLRNNDKRAYGSYLAYNSLKYFFPSSKIISLSESYRFSNIDDNMLSGTSGRNLMILSGLHLNVSVKEWEKLKSFVRGGNELVIFCNGLDEKIAGTFHLNFVSGHEEMPIFDPKYADKNKYLICNAADKAKRYGLQGCFAIPEAYGVDTTYSEDEEQTTYTIADTLGYSGNAPDCIRIAMGRGHVTIHAAPLVLSNYFLLQNDNITYLSTIWQSLPGDIDNIYWDNYYNHSSTDNTPNILFQFPATSWAIWLSIFTMLVYVLFQMKRRQRIIPVIPPLRNDSVSFVETVGRLYFNKGDHNNLAEKMVNQFLEWVRTKYLLNTNQLNDEFNRHLAMKSGQPPEVVNELTSMIHEVRLRSVKADEAYLYQLYNTIQQFYKNRHK